ncbi:condensation domain-containing protein [Labrys sp. 22185]|uniref:condensation domain-containing protein n=1 Tax=Labrys sp. 22185 TaxID=3453888 RepID=UPI003F871AE6
MAERSARLLSVEEMPRLDSVVQNGPDHSTMALTQAEEALWLRQQQDPDAVLKHVIAFRLDGAPDLPRLVAALYRAFEALPELNVRYRFSRDGELEKTAGSEVSSCLHIRRVETTAEAVNTLLAEQGATWDLERDAPIRALVLLSGETTILGFVVHRILGGVIRWRTLLQAVFHSYNGISSAMGGSAGGEAAPEVAEMEPAVDAEISAPPVPWLLRTGGNEAPGLIDFARAPLLERSLMARAAGRCGTLIETASLSALAGPQPTPSALIAAVALQFGRFLAQLGDSAAVDLSLPRRPATDMLDLSLPFCAQRFLRIILPRDVADTKDAMARILAGMASPAAGALDLRPQAERNDAPRPHAYVTWLTDPALVLPLEGISVERLPLPSLAARPDLALGLGRAAREDRLALELMAGQALSPAAGAFVLERFAGMLAGTAPLLGAPGFGHAVFDSQPDISASPASAPPDEGANAIEEIILAEFRQALSSPTMTADDDFFDHGGHSLIATRVIGRLLGSHGIEVNFNDLFRHPTAAGLAGLAQRHGATADVGVPAEADGSALMAPLSLAQNSLWKIYAAFGFGEIFNLPFALRFLDRVDETIFARAFQDVLERHSGLRTLFRQQEDGTVGQLIVAPEDLGAYKWFWHSHESQAGDRNQEAAYRFDLSHELPLRLRFLIEEETGQQVLSLLFHHMVLDEWSVNLMMDELGHAYRQRAAGKAPIWAEQPAPFHEFARLQHRAGLNQAHLVYWTDMLRDSPRNQQILPRPAACDDASRSPSNAGGWVELKLESAVTEGLYALAKANGASLFNVVYAAIASSLHLLGSLDELVVGTSASGRNEPDYFDTIGYFTTVVAHRVGFSPESTVAELIDQVKNTINGSLPNTDIPIDLVEEALGIVREQEHLFEVFIQLHAKNKFNGAFMLEDGSRIEFRQVDPERHESVLGLQFEVMEEKLGEERCIRVMMTYRSEHYDPQQVELIRQTVLKIFHHFAEPGSAGTRLVDLRPAIAAIPAPA